jgi:hypothetical protein
MIFGGGWFSPFGFPVATIDVLNGSVGSFHNFPTLKPPIDISICDKIHIDAVAQC